jgi:hypothetical protein
MVMAAGGSTPRQLGRRLDGRAHFGLGVVVMRREAQAPVDLLVGDVALREVVEAERPRVEP